jgi:dihydroxy-acid dehydratase
MQQKQMQQPARQSMNVSRVGRMLRVSAVSEKAGHKTEVPAGRVSGNWRCSTLSVWVRKCRDQEPPPRCHAGLNKYSSRITQPKSQGASQAMLYATGLKEEDMNKPQIGISSVWYEGNPCNMHLMSLAEEVKRGVEAAGMVGYRFNTIGVSDGISMGTDGMSFSLQSRDLIADSIETVMGAQWYDANISLPGEQVTGEACKLIFCACVHHSTLPCCNLSAGCDKNMPGTLIAMGRLNRPSLMIYGGTIKPGYSKLNNGTLDIVSAFQSYGECLSQSKGDGAAR